MVNSHPIALFFMVNSRRITLFLMVNSHPNGLSHGELLPHRSFSRGQLSPQSSFSHGQLSPHRSFLMINSHHIALFFIIFDVFFLLCDTDSKQAGWNQSVTNSCKKGTDIPFNQDTWHRNNSIKQGIKSLGPSVTENAVQRLSHMKSPLA